MATKQPAKAPSTRKKVTKRGPTKAAALKALGLTAEDVALLKELRDARAEVEALKTEAPAESPYEAEAYEAPARAAQAEVADARPVPTGFFMRNLRGAEVNFRLTRQQEKGKKRTELKPRGQRGDLAKLLDEDLEDSELDVQVNAGLIEIITAAEAKSVIEKQSTNIQQAVHPAIAILRTPTGKEYAEGAVTIEPEENSRGIVVAHLDPEQMQGRVDDKQVARGNPVQRVQPGQPAPQRQIGGNPAIISDGFNPEAVAPKDRAAAAADAAARKKNIEGPAAGGVLQVSVAPTKRT